MTTPTDQPLHPDPEFYDAGEEFMCSLNEVDIYFSAAEADYREYWVGYHGTSPYWLWFPYSEHLHESELGRRLGPEAWNHLLALYSLLQ